MASIREETRVPRRHGLSLYWLGLVALCSVSLAACGGAVGATPAKQAAGTLRLKAADQIVKAAEDPITNWEPAGPAFNASKARGKSIWYISASLSIPFEQYVLQGMKQAAAVVGATVTGFSANSSVTQITTGVQEAITAHANVIFIDGFIPSAVAPAIALAHSAGIPVVTANSQNPGTMLTGYPTGVVASATHSYTIPAKQMAAYVVANSKGKANVIYLSSTDVAEIAAVERNAFLAEMHYLCSACKVKVVASPTSEWSNLTTITASLIRENPKVDYYVPDFDGQVIFMVPGVTAANAQSTVKIVSFNATPSVMKNLKDHDVVAGDVGGPNLMQGWAFGDEAFRVLCGVTPLGNLNIPVRLFDSTNIGKVHFSEEESQWYGPLDYQAKFKKHWEVGK
jgi:ribose transport system substrate-binding protein